MGDLEGSTAGLLISVERGIFLYSMKNDRPGHLKGCNRYNASTLYNTDLIEDTYGVQCYCATVECAWASREYIS